MTQTIDSPTGTRRKYISQADVCDELDVSPSTFQKWVRQKIVTPAFEVGNTRRFVLEDVVEQLAAASPEGFRRRNMYEGIRRRQNQ